MISLIGLIPILGASFILACSWATGLVVASYNQPVYWILTNPFAWIELSVYSFVLLQSWRIIQFYRQRKTIKFWNLTAKTALTTIMVMGFILFLSAVLEYLTIH